MAQGSAPEARQRSFEGGQKSKGEKGEKDCWQKTAVQIHVGELLHQNPANAVGIIK